MKLRHLWLAGLLLLAGCATAPTSEHLIGSGRGSWQKTRTALEKIDGWQIEGKLGYKAGEQAGSGNLFWLQRRDYYDIRLAGPIGIGAVQLTGMPDKVRMDVAGQGSQVAASPEALLQQQLGWQLPVSHLLWWVRGMPAPDSPVEAEVSPNGYMAWLIQDGWQVNYLEYEPQGDIRLPSRLRLFGPQVEITLVIKGWQARQLGQ